MRVQLRRHTLRVFLEVEWKELAGRDCFAVDSEEYLRLSAEAEALEVALATFLEDGDVHALVEARSGARNVFDSGREALREVRRAAGRLGGIMSGRSRRRT